ncbi:hypothetical protein AUEXF2481DRAFT_462636 [Aureobasidium subglaciale EXF-2481]|uniref:Uncharacterized protein n=1 Tax=Aureobasidium subglaciale (strain EXF-2481) TaxID=1043005 RepID=A0A074YBR7_AURSE|nr:uncharacterized protein AUEXF2481DRAFT_462636 [Aureobasidium subglaciale EXF-2481]KEQ91597.1 hypothetical protein AUEXF2481DRAFT_462636 [Aureobasidium subglaciale EXF-2481]
MQSPSAPASVSLLSSFTHTRFFLSLVHLLHRSIEESPTTMTACSRVFDLPELLHLIISDLTHEAHSLCQILRINGAFFLCGIEYLWREVPVHNFQRISSSRRQLYANAIRDIHTTIKVGDHHEMFTGLSFPRLRGVDVVYAYSSNDKSRRPAEADANIEEHILVFLQPSIERFSFLGPPQSPIINLLRRIEMSYCCLISLM